MRAHGGDGGLQRFAAVLLIVATVSWSLAVGSTSDHALPPTLGTVGSAIAATGIDFAANAVITGPHAAGVPLLSAGLTLSISSGIVGSTVAATGAGFTANSTIAFSLARVAVTSACSTDSTGGFPGTTGTACTFTVPAAPGGIESVVASDEGNSPGIGVGAYPYGFAYDSGLGEVFVANQGSNNVSVISDVTNAVVATVAVGTSPFGIAYDSGLGEVFVVNTGSNNVSVISDATNAVVATVAVGTNPLAAVYDSGLGEVFVTNAGSNTVSVISDATNTVIATVAVGNYPYLGVVYDSSLGEVFVGNYFSNDVSVISDSNNSVVATVPVGNTPIGIAYDSGLGEVFVANIGSSNVSVISDATNSVVATVAVGTNPLAVVYDSGLGEVFVTNSGSDNVSVISDATNAVVASVVVGDYPYGVAYDSSLGEVLVTNYYTNNVSVISDVANAVIATVPVGAGPDGIAYDSARGGVFVMNVNSNNVSVIAPTNQATALFNVNSSVTLLTSGGSVDVGQTVIVEGAGYGNSLDISTFSLGSYLLNCTGAMIGTCVGGALTTVSNGSLVATFVVPSVSTSGSYAVKLVDSAGNSATGSITVYSDPIVAVPSASRASTDVGQPVTFSSTAAFGTGTYTYAWSGLPAGCGGAQASIICAPTAAGSFSISVRVTDSNGFSVSSGTLSFITYSDPTVTAPTGSSPSGQVDGGQSATFTTTANLGTATYIGYAWSGLPGGCAGTTAVVVCSGPNLPAGAYAISVTVTDSNDFTSIASGILLFTVVADPSVTTPSSTRTSVDLGQSATFSASASSGAGLYSYAWTGLPAGCGSSTDTVLCKPTAAGLHSVRLAVTDSNNFTVTSGALAFSVYLDPTADLSADRVAFDAGQSVTLTASAGLGSGTYAYAWIGLPTNCSGTTATITCSPSRSGNFSVIVKITDSNGVAATSPVLLLIVAAPLFVEFSPTPTLPTSGESVTFTANVSGGTGAITYAWAFGDGSKGAGSTVTHAFGSAGTFTVSLSVNDSGGGSVVKTFDLTVVNPATSLLGAPSGIWLVGGILAGAIVVVAAVTLFRRRRQPVRPPDDSDQVPPEVTGIEEGSAGSSPREGSG